MVLEQDYFPREGVGEHTPSVNPDDSAGSQVGASPLHQPSSSLSHTYPSTAAGGSPPPSSRQGVEGHSNTGPFAPRNNGLHSHGGALPQQPQQQLQPQQQYLGGDVVVIPACDAAAGDDNAVCTGALTIGGGAGGSGGMEKGTGTRGRMSELQERMELAGSHHTPGGCEGNTRGETAAGVGPCSCCEPISCGGTNSAGGGGGGGGSPLHCSNKGMGRSAHACDDDMGFDAVQNVQEQQRQQGEAAGVVAGDGLGRLPPSPRNKRSEGSSAATELPVVNGLHTGMRAAAASLAVTLPPVQQDDQCMMAAPMHSAAVAAYNLAAAVKVAGQGDGTSSALQPATGEAEPACSRSHSSARPHGSCSPETSAQSGNWTDGGNDKSVIWRHGVNPLYSQKSEGPGGLSRPRLVWEPPVQPGWRRVMWREICQQLAPYAPDQFGVVSDASLITKHCLTMGGYVFYRPAFADASLLLHCFVWGMCSNAPI
jgi:hypothetical protein